MFQDFLYIFIHLYSFCFLLRAFFPVPNEIYFFSVMRTIRDWTDPVLLFFKNNRMFSRPLHPLIPLLVLLLFKAFLIQSGGNLGGRVPFQDIFLFSVKGFLSFLFSSYLLLFWIVFSSDKLRLYGDLFDFFKRILERSMSLFMPDKNGVIQLHQRYGAMFATLLLLFFLAFFVLNLKNGPGLALIHTLHPAGSALTGVKAFVYASFSASIVQVLNILHLFIIVRIVLSFFDPSPNLPYQVLFASTEYYLSLFRRLRLVIGFFDFSPIIAIFALGFISKGILNLFLALSNLVQNTFLH